MNSRQTAINVRESLASLFPHYRFSVKRRRNSDTVTVSWEDGPPANHVAAMLRDCGGSIATTRSHSLHLLRQVADHAHANLSIPVVLIDDGRYSVIGTPEQDQTFRHLLFSAYCAPDGTVIYYLTN